MKTLTKPVFATLALVGALSLATRAAETDWPQWRGPRADGIAATATPPLTWSATKNVRWKVQVPGSGHASPVVVDDRVFIAAADETAGTQSLLCYHRNSGRLLWQQEVHKGRMVSKYAKNSQASATPACDGQRVYTLFVIDDALHATAYDLDGNKVWQVKVGPYESEHGYGSSPVLYKETLLVANDHLGEGGGALLALDRATGKTLWKTPRKLSDRHANYSTPAVGVVAGRPQVVVHGYENVISYNPDTGKELWRVDGPTDVCANTVVLGQDHVYASGGYPRKDLLCIRADGTGDVTNSHVTWNEGKAVAYVPSSVLHDGRLYVINDQGIASCFDATEGRIIWRERVNGRFSASFVLVGDRLYAPSEEGVTYVLQTGDTFKVLAENTLPGGHLATHAFSGDMLFARTNDTLYCLVEDPAAN